VPEGHHRHGAHDHAHHHEPHPHDHASHQALAGAQSFWIDAATSWPGIAAWWHLLVERYGARLLRCKGLLRIAGSQPAVLIQGVGTHFYAPQPLPTSHTCT
jgi:G3E family GTPase